MKWIKKRDIIVVVIIFVIAVGMLVGIWMVNRNKPPMAEVYYNQELVQSIALDENKEETIPFSKNPNIVFHLFKDGSIGFESSDCPDKICIRTGKLRFVGESAVCLPNDCILKIVPADKGVESEVDIIG